MNKMTTLTGNSSFQKIRGLAAGLTELQVGEGKMGSLRVDLLAAGTIVPGQHGPVTKVTGYTPLEFSTSGAPMWLNTTPGLVHSTSPNDARRLTLPANAKVVAATVEDGTVTTAPAGLTKFDIGLQASISTPSNAASIFKQAMTVAVRKSVGFNFASAKLGTAGVEDPDGPTTPINDVTGVTVNPSATMTAGNLVVTLYYVL